MIDYLKRFRLEGYTAFVVGGLGLIGKEVSTAFSMAGAKTIVLDVNKAQGELFENEMKANGYDLSFRFFDCANMENLDQSYDLLLQEFKSPHIFINGSYPRTEDWARSSFKDISLKSYRENVDMHMNSYVWLARLAAEDMVNAQISGNIIQLGSTYGVVGQDLGIYEGTDMHENMSYAAIKGGITNLTRLMASYYGQYNIRVNNICAGGLEGHVAGKSATQDTVFKKQYCKRTPLKRLGRADEIASTALFLASDAASYITGATVMVDGGWTAV